MYMHFLFNPLNHIAKYILIALFGNMKTGQITLTTGLYALHIHFGTFWTYILY